MGEWEPVFRKDLNWFGRRLKERQFRVLDRISKKYGVRNAVEIGCGSGWLLRYMIKHGVKAVGIDNEQSVITKLSADGLPAKLMDANHLDFADGKFDIAYSDGVLEHFKDPARAISEMSKISRRYVLTMVPYHQSVFGYVMRFWHWAGRFPTEHIRGRSEWIRLHERAGLRLLESGTLNLGEELWFLFEKGS